MKRPATYNHSRAQTSIEYLLLLSVVAVIVIASFYKGSLISQVHDSAQNYYTTVSGVIMGNYNPKPIQGGWCTVTCPLAGTGPQIIYSACECPAPAFGGQTCVQQFGQSSTPCGPGKTCKGFAVSCSGVTSP